MFFTCFYQHFLLSSQVYYEAKAKKLKEQKDSARGGVHNDGYDDVNYDYILLGDEIVLDRYILKHRMGKVSQTLFLIYSLLCSIKCVMWFSHPQPHPHNIMTMISIIYLQGSFGQVVCAYDRELKCEVAIKIIKSRKPFQVQAQTEINILKKVLEKDVGDESNIVRLLNQFMYRNHQCLVFEILSFNLYELLKNTRYHSLFNFKHRVLVKCVITQESITKYINHLLTT